MTFPEFVRAEVLRLGDGVASRGEILAGIALGYSPRKIRMWASGEEPHPTPAEVAGARLLLPRCGSPSATSDCGASRRRACRPVRTS